MVSLVSLCTLRGVPNDNISDYQSPGSIITASTTLEEFDAECAKYPSYQLNNTSFSGFTALHVAAEKDNVPLIKHIVRIGGKELLSIGNKHAKTPLFCAIENNKRAATITLIKLGSPINMQCLEVITRYDEIEDDLMPGQTPLTFVVQKATDWSDFPLSIIQEVQKLAMAKILLFYGAVAIPAVDVEGAKILQEAEKELNEMQASLVKEVYEGTESILAPFDVVKMIASYVPLDEFLVTIPRIDPY